MSKINLSLINIDKHRIIKLTRGKNLIIFDHTIISVLLLELFKDLSIILKVIFFFKINHRTVINIYFKMLGFINKNTDDFRNHFS